MNLDRVSSGSSIPDEINVIIEIPAHSDPVKYEADKETGAMFVDRFMSSAMFYPCNYGHVPHTPSWVRVEGWGDIDDAKAEIMSSVAMYKEAPVKPNF